MKISGEGFGIAFESEVVVVGGCGMLEMVSLVVFATLSVESAVVAVHCVHCRRKQTRLTHEHYFDKLNGLSFTFIHSYSI